jgi:hypothetical protein
VQLREAISSFDEDLEETLLDYILYYVFIRSKSTMVWNSKSGFKVQTRRIDLKAVPQKN